MNNTQYYTLLNESSVPTYWQPNATINRQIQQNSQLTSNWKYRQYIQANANQIMKYNTMESIYSSGNNPYVVDNKVPSSNVPHIYRSTHDNSNPSYGYSNSDLKQSYMRNEQMTSRMVAPSIRINDIISNLETNK